MDNDDIKEFIIREPCWTFYFSVILVTIFLSLLIAISVLYCLSLVSFLNFIITFSVAVAFFIVSLFCLVGYFRKKFLFKNGMFSYINMIGKKHSVKIEDLAIVNLYFNGFVKVKDYSYIKLYPKGYVQIEMLDGEGKIALKFSDNYGTVFKNGLFGSVLTQKNIRVKEFF